MSTNRRLAILGAGGAAMDIATTPWFVWLVIGSMTAFGVVLGLTALFTASK